MGFSHLLNAVLGLQQFPPFALEIIVVAVLIILLACPVPLAEYYNFTNEIAYPICQTSTLTEDEGDVGEPSILTKIRSKTSIHDSESKCDVPKVLEHTASLIKSIESTLKHIDKTNNDIIVNNVTVCNKISDTTFVRAFQLDEIEPHHDRHVDETSRVDLGKAGEKPLSYVDTGRDSSDPDGLDVDTADSNVSDGRDHSLASEEHASVVSDGDEEQTADGVPVSVARSVDLLALRRTDEITHLSGILVASPVVEVTTPSPLDARANRPSLTDLILDAKLDLNMVRDGLKQRQKRGKDAETVSSESDSTATSDDDSLVFEHRTLNADGSESELLENVSNRPRNSERPRRSLDALQDEVDYQDLENISNEALKNNKQFFVDKFINDEEIKNHARFTRSKREILIEEIPIDRGRERRDSLGNLGTLIESDFEAEDKYINPKFTMNDTSSDSDFQIHSAGIPAIEESDIAVPPGFGTARPGVCEYDALSKISEENCDSKEASRYKSFSTFSDFKTRNKVLEKLNANRDAIITEDMMTKRCETILDCALNSHDKSSRSNPFLDVTSGSLQDRHLSKPIKGEESDILASENIKKLHHTFKRASDIGVAKVSLPIPIPSLNSHHANQYLSENFHYLEKDINNVTSNKDIDLSKMPSRCRLIFGFESSAFSSNEDVLQKPGTCQNTSITENMSGIAADNSSCWKFRENVKSRKIVFDKDTFLRHKEGSFHVFNANSGSMNNLFGNSDTSFSSNKMYGVNSQASYSGKDDVARKSSYVEKCKREESGSENDPATSSAEATKVKTSRTSLPKLKLLSFKMKSGSSDSSPKVSGNDLTEGLSPTPSKSKSKTSKRSRAINNNSNAKEGVVVVSKEEEDQSCSPTEDVNSRAGPSVTHDVNNEVYDDDDHDIFDDNTLTKLFHKITRKLKGSSSTKTTPTTPTNRRQTRDDRNAMTVQNKLYVYKGNRDGVAAFPADEDAFAVDRNARSLDYFYSELQSDHHSLKITANKTNIPDSGSSTDTNTDLHLAPLMEDVDE